MRATCHALLIPLDLITLTIYGEAYKLRSSSLCNSLQLPPAFLLLGQNILFDTLNSNHPRLLKSPSICPSLQVRDKFHTIRLEIFLFTTVCRPALGPTQPPIQWIPGSLSLDVRWPVSKADHSPPSSAEVKNACSCTSTPPIRLHDVVLS
jgi:hypothetical protein